jgi:hypothetical protein
MKKARIVLLMAMMVDIWGCTATKMTYVRRGDIYEDAIQIAISDFSTISKLYKNDSVFSVGISGLINYENIIVVGVRKNNRKLLLTNDAIVGSTKKLPSRYIEKDGKLFFWWDDSCPLTEDALSVYRKYNLLQDDQGGIIKLPDSIIDDAQKAAHYYFCKEDVSKHKKVITNIGIGFYDPPSLKCIDKN